MTHPLSQRLRDMHAMAADLCDPAFNKALMDALMDAAKEIDKLMGDVIRLRSQVERADKRFAGISDFLMERFNTLNFKWEVNGGPFDRAWSDDIIDALSSDDRA